MAKKPSINNITTGYTSAEAINENFQNVRDAFDNTLSLDGSIPNAMNADLDMNGNSIINADTILVGGTDYLAQALAYRNAAQAAQTGAEAAKTSAEASEDAALVSENNAAASATIVTNNKTNIDTIAANLADLNTVAGISANVSTVAGISSDVTTVAADGIDIGVVAGISSDVTTVSGISSNVTTVAGISSAVTSVAADATDIGTVSANIGNVNTVAGISGNVTTVAGITGNIASVVGNAADISTVAGIAGFVPTLSNVSNEISAVAGNLSKITTANSNAASITTVANNITDVNTVAGISGSVSTVAGITGNIASVVGDSAEINTVAGISSNVTSVASNASNINTVSANISNVNTVAGISADIQSVADRLPSVETALDNFDDIYLGPKSSAPTLDNDGDALLTGALYFNTSNTTMFVWDGNSWEPTPAQNFIDPNTELTQDLNTDTYDILFGDNAKAIFGADSDLQIYYQSSTNGSYVKGSGQTYIQGSNLYFKNGNGNQTYIYCANNGGVSLQHGSASDTKFATTPTGVNVTGNATFGDNGKAIFGASSDLQIYHDGNNSFIQDSGTGDLIVRASNNLYLQSYAGAENYLTASTNGAVTLYYDNAPKLATTSTGIDVTGTVTAGSYDLDAIAASKAVTAVDVFVYDTSKDSDGGAWRKRTQNTSWYNETLNTATRGSRKEFPAVAVIVYSSSSKDITIYDGDDPDMPMWMVFQDGGGEMLYAGGTPSSVTALNGEIVSGQYGVGALCHFNFIKDYGYVRINSSSEYNGSNIAKRNNNFSSDTVTGTTGALVSRSIYDVAMTVLPNAPIDATTGLPVPTIAVATDGGVSVIKDDGTVVDITHNNSTFTETNYVVLSEEGTVTLAYNNGEQYGWVYTLNIPSSDTVITVNAQSPAVSWFDTRNPLSFNQDLWISNTGGSNGVKLNAMASQFPKLAFGTTTALTNTVDNLGTEPYLFNYISDTYNTGWMNGDIKLATLSDTDATNVTGAELVTNGTFDTDTSGWTGHNGATLSVVSGVLRATNDGSTSYPYAQQVITTEVGKTYTVSARALTSPSHNWYIEVATLGNSGQKQDEYQSHTFTATSTSTTIRLIHRGAANGDYKDFDDVSVRLAEADRSVNGNGLQVFGTVTKSAVSSGADLVGYSGFSTSNYLEQPYNSDLDFGTGDFCYMGWFKTSSNGITMFERCASPRSGNGMTVYMDGTGKPLWYKIVSGTPTIVVTPTAAYNNNTWVHFAAIRQNGVVSLYFNGQKDGSASDSTDMTNSSAIFRLGANATGTSGWTGSLALWRISATVPSPEQILKIYNDEKHLFTEGAQATLYGSSDSVTALAFDDTTNLLHVGTSAGRSVFQGLRRVDNTTTAVTSAISASNGLVADE